MSSLFHGVALRMIARQAAGVTGVVVEIIYARLFIDPDLHYVDRALRIDLFKTLF